MRVLIESSIAYSDSIAFHAQRSLAVRNLKYTGGLRWANNPVTPLDDGALVLGTGFPISYTSQQKSKQGRGFLTLNRSKALELQIYPCHSWICDASGLIAMAS